MWASVVAGRKPSITKPIPGTTNVLFPELSAATSHSVSQASSSRSSASGSYSSSNPMKIKSSPETGLKKTPEEVKLDLSSLSEENDKDRNGNESPASGNSSGKALKVAFKLEPQDSDVVNSDSLQSGSISHRLSSYADACRSPCLAVSNSQSQSSSFAYNVRDQHHNSKNSSQLISSSKSSGFSHHSYRNNRNDGKSGSSGNGEKKGGGESYGHRRLEALERPWTGRQISKARSESNSHSQRDYPDNYQYRRAFSGGHTVSPASNLNSASHNSLMNGDYEEQTTSGGTKEENDHNHHPQGRHERGDYKGYYKKGQNQGEYERANRRGRGRGHHHADRGKGNNQNHRGRGRYEEVQDRDYKWGDGKKWTSKSLSGVNNFHGGKEGSNLVSKAEGIHSGQNNDKTSNVAEDRDSEGFHQVRHGKGRHHDH